jgi:hypothetical protein
LLESVHNGRINRVRFPMEARTSHHLQICSVGHLTSYTIDIQGKSAERKADHSVPKLRVREASTSSLHASFRPETSRITVSFAFVPVLLFLFLLYALHLLNYHLLLFLPMSCLISFSFPFISSFSL